VTSKNVKYGVMLVSYESMGEMYTWIRDDVEGTHIASFEDRNRAVDLAQKYQTRDPKGDYQVRETPVNPEAPDGLWVPGRSVMWADSHITDLQNGKTVKFRPRGNSMTGRVKNGQLVTVAPATHPLEVGSVVLCKVSGNQYLHLVLAVGSDGRYQIGNNKGGVNGWCVADNIYGILTSVED